MEERHCVHLDHVSVIESLVSPSANQWAALDLGEQAERTRDALADSLVEGCCRAADSFHKVDCV